MSYVDVNINNVSDVCKKKKIMQFNIKVHKLNIIAVFIFVVTIASTTRFFSVLLSHIQLGDGGRLQLTVLRQEAGNMLGRLLVYSRDNIHTTFDIITI